MITIHDDKNGRVATEDGLVVGCEYGCPSEEEWSEKGWDEHRTGRMYMCHLCSCPCDGKYEPYPGGTIYGSAFGLKGRLDPEDLFSPEELRQYHPKRYQTILNYVDPDFGDLDHEELGKLRIQTMDDIQALTRGKEFLPQEDLPKYELLRKRWNRIDRCISRRSILEKEGENE